MKLYYPQKKKKDEALLYKRTQDPPFIGFPSSSLPWLGLDPRVKDHEI
jgi:hypothetical protein